MLTKPIVNILKNAKQEADLSKKFISDEHLKDIVAELNTHYPNIKELNLAHNPIRDSGLKHLAALVHVERLDLTDTHVNGEEIKELLNSNIQTFILDDCNLNSDVQQLITEAERTGKIISHAKCTFVDSFTPSFN